MAVRHYEEIRNGILKLQKEKRGVWLGAEEFQKLVEKAPAILHDLKTMADAKLKSKSTDFGQEKSDDDKPKFSSIIQFLHSRSNMVTTKDVILGEVRQKISVT